jgi:coenzyme F420-0:L-glutamate ligase/coenzyme F420-1:gamma-L-glutamate ligase
VDARTRQFLERQRVAHLATTDATGVPHVVPVCFVVDGDTLYIAIDEKPKSGDIRRLRRLRNIAENPHVAIVADVYDDNDWSRLGFVLVRGVARVVEASTGNQDALRLLREKYAQYRAMRLEERPLIAIDIGAVAAWGDLSQLT